MAHAYNEFDWYETPLYYDIIFDAETERECDFLEAMYERYVTRGKRRVLEPACGSGRLVAEMARRGYDVTGLDISDGALAFARKRLADANPRGPASASKSTRTQPSPRMRATVVHAPMQAFSFKRGFDMAHCLVSSFKYLLSEADARAHLECVASALRPGGIYVLGFHLTEYSNTSYSRERWVASRGDIRVVCNIQTWPAERKPRRERMRSRFVVERNGRVDRYQTEWEFRTYDARQFRALLARVPALELIATYDFDYNLDQPRAFGKDRLDQVVILARRA